MAKKIKKIEKNEKPKVKLIGQDGNVFNLIAICKKALCKNGLVVKAKEMEERIFKSKSYDDALSIMSDYLSIE